MSLDVLVAEGRIETNVPLAPLTTYRFGGPAAYLFHATSVADLTLLAEALKEAELDVLVLGRGSNLVVSEAGYGGVVVRLGEHFATIATDGVTVRARAMSPLPQIARVATAAGVRGLEFLIGVPGSLGGGVRQNAGCFGSELVDVLASAQVFDLRTQTNEEVPTGQLDMSYRHSSVRSSQVVIEATLVGTEGDPEEGLSQIREHTRWRRLHQPGGTLNAGSVFKNPPGDSAGRIIDSLGLKGMRVGGASVSEKHANFFVAMPGTEPSQVYLLVQEVSRIVREELGIELEPEIQFVGEFEGTGV